ncbi:HAD family hydrolase [Roseibacillus persicicus]|uniref:HAD family hydrolase n=1 Tax=Roseibacillus persicicus TaxID=454148 RepID=UPI0028108BA7|nr:HAD family hydrolase [Roseibacillus persicicus]MDQ8192404.1 HAD family hydrolase [Roseibacillus persicicus]
METLPLVEEPAGILAFDFDGTLHWPEHRPPVDRRMLEWLEFLRERHKFIWGICTGRSLMHLVEGLADSFPFLPDFVVAREREIHFPGRFGRFVPDEDWNRNCDRDHKKLFKKVRKELSQIRKYVEETAKGEWVQIEGDLAGVVLPHEKEMEGLLREVERVCGKCEDLGHERNGVYLRFSHSAYGKGPALKEIAQRVGVPPEKVIAAGDNFNDLTMLSPEITAWPVCPGNAVPEVKKRVRMCDGVVGESLASAGLVEAFEEIFVARRWSPDRSKEELVE